MATDEATITAAITIGETMMTGIGFGTNSRMRTGSGWASTSEFDDFLSASVGEERNGRLSVISMFGRLDIDPRQEAHKLANLPRTAAIHRLALLIESLPDRMASATDPKAIATRLLTRLPLRKMPRGSPVSQTDRGAGLTSTSIPWMMILAAALAIWLSVELYSQSRPVPSSEPTKIGTNRP